MRIGILGLVATNVCLACSACGGNSPLVADATAVDAPTAAGQPGGVVLLVEDALGGSASTISGVGFAITESRVTSRDDGPCHIEVDETTGATTQTSAGPVTISDGSADTFVLTPDSTNMYSGDEFQGLRYAAGDLVSFSATGATVPAFTGAITFPANVVVTSPSSLTTLSEGGGFSLTWTTTTSPVHVVITQYPDSAHSIDVDCTYAGHTGAAAIPATALSDLMVETPATVLVASESLGSGMAGDYALEFLAADYAFEAGVTVEP